MASHNCFCCVDGCKTIVHENVSFFRCPKNPDRCRQWKNILGFVGEHKYAELTNEEAHSRIRICCKHFDKKSFTSSGKRLLTTPVPSKLLQTLNRKLRDSQCQTTLHLSQNTPRKQSLKRKLAEAHKELKLAKMHNETTFVDVVRFLEENYEQDAINLIKNQLLLLNEAPKRARYTNEFKQFALNLFLLGPKAYTKLSKIMRLPSHSTL
ncbi:hypothetical protein ABEB36_010812 [Hypothenemus hampei]|uniref:THAP-type domain-containing protein n=1 Tax=Hypothenemus hampei TaxID=57062 RepID=A0ABD1EF66_HYPHA